MNLYVRCALACLLSLAVMILGRPDVEVPAEAVAARHAVPSPSEERLEVARLAALTSVQD